MVRNIFTVGIGVVSCLFSMTVSAQTPVENAVSQESIYKIETSKVLPLDMILFSPTANVPLSGRVFLGSERGVKRLVFKLFDDRQDVVWSQRTLENEKIEDRFTFAFDSIKFKGNFMFHVIALDEFGAVLSRGSRMVKINEGLQRLGLSNLTLNEKDSVLQVKTFFQNNNESRKVRLNVSVWKNSGFRKLVQTVKSDLFSLKALEKKSIGFALANNLKPGGYVFEASVVGENNEILTGFVEEGFFVKGEVIQLEKWKFSLDRYLSQKQVDVFFEGNTFGEPFGKSLEAELVLVTDEKTLFSQRKKLKTDNRVFAGDFNITFLELVPQFRGKLKIWKEGQVVLVKDFESPFMGSQNIKSTVPVENNLQKSKTSFFSNILFILIAVFVVAMLLFLFGITMMKKYFRIWLLVLLCVPMSAFAVSAAGNPYLRWYHPVDGWFFNPTDTNGFQTIRIEGEVYDKVIPPSTFLSQVQQYRVKFKNSVGVEKEYAYDPMSVTVVDDKKYFWEVDSSTLTDFYSTFGDDKLFIQVLLYKGGSCPTVNSCAGGSWYGTDTLAGDASEVSIDLDATSPTLSLQYEDDIGNIASGFTNKPTTIKVACFDSGAGCMDDEPAIDDGDGIGVFAPYDVKGNFCGASNCDDTATRVLKVCDQVGNCREQELVINWYDPIKPIINQAFVKLGAFLGTLRVNSTYDVQLDYEDPENSTPEASIPSYNPDNHTCGDGAVSEFYEQGNRCVEDSVVCVDNSSKRGISTNGGACVGVCPINYEEDAGFCVPICSSDTFEPVNMCFDTTGYIYLK